jgi:uncharacterized protein YjbI with pentapeptide repeats
MGHAIHEDKLFEKNTFKEADFKNQEFEKCTFSQCDFSNANLSGARFSDCSFVNCNLAMAKLNNTGLRTVLFKECKLIGLNFSECENFLFHVYFENSNLDYASFMNKKLTQTKFTNTSLKDVNFTNCNLSGAVFHQTDLTGALFNRTLLKQADLTTAFNFIIDPVLNDLKKARFSLQGLPGLLVSFDISVE